MARNHHWRRFRKSDRTWERRAAHDWNARLGGRIRYMEGGKGGWILRTPRS